MKRIQRTVFWFASFVLLLMSLGCLPQQQPPLDLYSEEAKVLRQELCDYTISYERTLFFMNPDDESAEPLDYVYITKIPSVDKRKVDDWGYIVREIVRDNTTFMRNIPFDQVYLNYTDGSDVSPHIVYKEVQCTDKNNNNNNKLLFINRGISCLELCLPPDAVHTVTKYDWYEVYVPSHSVRVVTNKE